jgi:hypothetical protein
VVLLLVLACVLSVQPCAATELGPQPSPNELFQLQKLNRPRPWLYITSDSGSLTRRVRLIDRQGLYDLSARDGSTQAGPMPWSDIRRIDEEVTRAKQFRRYGAFVLGLAFAGLGNALGAPDDKGGEYAMLGLGIGVAVGGKLGRHLGESHKRPSRPWYVATEPAQAAPAAQDTSVAAPDSTAFVAARADTSSGHAPPDSAKVLHASERIHPERLLRVHSSFGIFEGYAGVSGPDGLERLKPRHPPKHASTAPPLPPLMSWAQIDRVEVRGGSALSGAVAGAVGFAAFGALLGAAAVSLAESDVTAAEGAGIGAIYLAPVGFALGGLTGMAARHWTVLYKR